MTAPTPVAPVDGAVPETAAADHARVFLPQVQALRALAVALVIAFHLWPDVVTGGYVGVDVFFVLSGYLITGQLAEAVAGGSRFSLLGFWARRVRRLLPLALTVLAATLAFAVAFVPRTMWQPLARAAAASALYSLNWVLASDAADYFASEQSATAVQHYWSLSVEEQFYLAWPLLIGGGAWLARRSRRSVTQTLSWGVGVVIVASFAYSVWYSIVDPERAYYSPFTHAWEFAAGGLVVLATGGRAAGRSGTEEGRAVLSWAGILAIVGSALVLDGSVAFPGWVAAVAVAGTLAVTVAGRATGPLGTAQVLELPAVQYLGDVSYGAYLWHWPLIVLVPVAIGRPFGLVGSIAVVGVTIALAAVSKRYIEDPIRSSVSLQGWRPSGSLVASVVASVLVVQGAAIAWVDVNRSISLVADDIGALTDAVLDGDLPCFGASAMQTRLPCADRFRIDPGLDLVSSAVPRGGDLGTPRGPVIPLTESIDAHWYGAADGSRTVAVVGDSHAAMYLPAVLALAERHDWRVLRIQQSDCTPSAPTWKSYWHVDNGEGCVLFRRRIMAELGAAPVDLIITSSVSPRYADNETPAMQSVIADAFADMWRSWLDGGVPVVVIADAPGPGDDAHACLERSRDRDDPCASPPEEVLERDPMVVAAQRHPHPDLHLTDLTASYCDETCHMAIGGLAVYQGGAHISAAFALSLAPMLEPVLLDALGAGG